MKFAVISDIQGNVTALKAVLADLDARHKRLDRIVCAGDVVGLGPHPNEVISALRDRGIETARGNYDDAVAGGRTESGTDFPDLAGEQTDARALRWTRSVLTEESLAFLQSLPADLRLSPGAAGVRVTRSEGDEKTAEYRRTFIVRSLFGGMIRTPVTPGMKVMVVHGSPRANNEFVRADTANSILAVIAREANTDVLITGHAGTTFKREAQGMTFVGVGRVTGSAAHPSCAEYAVVRTGETLEVEFGRVEYDPRPHVEAMLQHGLPGALIAPFQVESG